MEMNFDKEKSVGVNNWKKVIGERRQDYAESSYPSQAESMANDAKATIE
jgi:hypothetical protein